MAERTSQTGPESGRAGTFTIHNADGRSDLVLVCEHASNFIPAIYAGLGLDAEALNSHIAWDPGAAPVAKTLSTQLDAPLIMQNVSRLIYDCNRPPEAEAAMPPVSEIYPVPGNDNLTPEERDLRVRSFYHPFRDGLAKLIAGRTRSGASPAIVTIHSFTPSYMGLKRDYHLGILHDADARMADLLLGSLNGEAGLDVRRNMPYGPGDGVTHTLKVHALPFGLANVMIEIRNDLIATPEGQADMAERLATHIGAALKALAAPSGHGGRTVA